VRILVTGGAGYIGSHTVVALLEAGHDVVVLDDLDNSSAEAVRRVGELGGREVELLTTDLRDEEATASALARVRPDAVIHFAALKAVGESVAQPERYYRTNVGGTLNLVKAMDAVDCRTLVFSSSATVYGAATEMPLTEDSPLGATNPYGWSKFMVEQVLRDVATSDDRWSIGLLRYFNPVGAHPSGRIGEDPRGVPNNLVPFIAQVAVGRRDELTIYGDDFDTPDGTGVRDYIHVSDLIAAHMLAYRHLRDGGDSGVFNCGYGRGFSVRQVIEAVEDAAGHPLTVRELPRRPGDASSVIADPSRIKAELGWTPQHDELGTIVRDALAWERRLEPASAA
jgi:UDP-glucose 4-epimerase